MTITVILTLLLIVVTLSVLLFKTYKKVQEIQLYLDEKESEYQKLRQKYQPLIDIDQALDVRQLQLHDWDSRITKRSFEHDALCLKLAIRYKEKRDTYESLLKEVSVLEENLENISYGLYKPQYNYSTSLLIRLHHIRH